MLGPGFLLLLLILAALLLLGAAGLAARALWRRELCFLIREGTAWVEAQRDLHRATAQPLSDEQQRHLAPFFPPDLLARTRIKQVAMVDNPSFFTRYTRWKLPLPMDFREAAGLALVDTILVTTPLYDGLTTADLSLLFHELVHLVQYDAFGTSGFLERYVRGWISKGFRYRAIPLEAQAYQLQAHFERAPDLPFSVAEDVRRRFGPPPQQSS